MSVLLVVLLVALGGGAGSALRWGIGEAWVSRLDRDRSGTAGKRDMPWPVFGANVLACFLLGIIAVEFGSATAGAGRFAFLLLATGFCGGLSTLSTAALDTVQLMRRGTGVLATSYVLLTVGASMAALWLGVVIAA